MVKHYYTMTLTVVAPILPDLTVVTPLLNRKKNKILFLFANRAHHSDIGGITPGSMPAFSKSIYEEGALFNGFTILKRNKVLDKKIIGRV